jgi:hypothetical protein
MSIGRFLVFVFVKGVHAEQRVARHAPGYYVPGIKADFPEQSVNLQFANRNMSAESALNCTYS